MRLKRADQLLTFASTFTPPCSLHALARTVALSVVPSAQAYVRWTAFLVARAAFLVPFTVALPICFAASAVSLPASFVACPAFFVSSLAPVSWASAMLAVAQSVAMASAEMNRRMTQSSITAEYQIVFQEAGCRWQVAGGCKSLP